MPFQFKFNQLKKLLTKFLLTLSILLKHTAMSDMNIDLMTRVSPERNLRVALCTYDESRSSETPQGGRRLTVW